MNWYQKFLRFAHRNPLDIDAIAICEDVLKNIRQLYFSKRLSNQTISFKPEVKNKNPLQKNQEDKESLAEEEISVINVTIENLRINEEFIAGGNFVEYKDENDPTNPDNHNDLNLIIRVSNKFSNKSFEPLYMRLLDVVRHEIRHLYDSDQEKEITLPPFSKQVNIIDNANQASRRILSEAEKPAYIEGLILRAKRERVSFRVLVSQTVANFFLTYLGDYKNKPFDQNTINQIEQLEQLENSTSQTIIQNALIRYPKLQ